MEISRKDVGFGKYAWYIDGKITELSEPEIIDIVGKDNEKKFFSLLNYCGNFEIEISNNKEIINGGFENDEI